MNKLDLIKNPYLFQGQKYLNTNNDYFEGWYFKNTNKESSIAFIPGININNKDKQGFIQVIINDSSYYINYCIHDFKFNFEPFYIKIGNNIFSKESIHIDIKDDIQKLKIYGDIKYSESKNITTNLLCPNIMGPFSYIPFMECNHAIISMRNKTEGFININNNKIDFNNSIGYIEKDWGCSFPKSYIWCQGNNFQNPKISFMLSIADIPFKFFNFRGIICSLILENQELKFTTYNGTRITKYEIGDNLLNITLKKGAYDLDIKSKYDKGIKLIAPIKGKMEKRIFESITALTTITLKKNNNIILSDTSTNCGLEIV